MWFAITDWDISELEIVTLEKYIFINSAIKIFIKRTNDKDTSDFFNCFKFYHFKIIIIKTNSAKLIQFGSVIKLISLCYNWINHEFEYNFGCNWKQIKTV